jgi:hypothetical protein
MIVFAGAQGVASPSPCLNDVNVLEYATGVGGTAAWDLQNPIGGPPRPRYGHTAVYDADDNLMIVFGGSDCSATYFNDVWVLRNANGQGGTPAWSQLIPDGAAPVPRAFTSAVYDSTNSRMIVFGGFNGNYLGDLWVLVNANGMGGTPVWIQVSPGGSTPSPRQGHSAVYEAATNRMIVFGGQTGGQTRVAEAWVLSNANGLRGSPSWSLMAPNTATPQARSLHSAVFVPTSSKMIIFGGQFTCLAQGCNPSDNHVYALNGANAF